jgi:site-specific recombinase XerD
MINEQDLKAFEKWLKDRGRSRGTIDLYLHDVTTAFAVGGFTDRLGQKELAPKTRHRIRTAGRQWARFFDDAKLEHELRDYRLPKAQRASAKTPITRTQLFALIDEIDSADYLEPMMRAVLGMLACRGFRVGDVLRLRRTELCVARDTGVLAFEAKGGARVEFRLLSTFKRYALALANAEEKWARVDALISPRAKRQRRKAAARAVARALTEAAVRCGIYGVHPHRLRRTYAVEYLKGLAGDSDALMKLKQHMQWESLATVMEYVDHARGQALDDAAEKIFVR